MPKKLRGQKRTFINMERKNYQFISQEILSKADYEPENRSDPDEVCEDLYLDLKTVVEKLVASFQGNLPPIRNLGSPKRNRAWGLAESGEDYPYRYGSDYIGPSQNWAKPAGLSNAEIGDFVSWSRELGGHILWLRHPNSINQNRGGKIYYDRLDLTLAELLHFMKNPGPDQNHLINPGLRNALVTDADWFDRFKPEEKCTPEAWFKSFIDFWRLEGFVTKDYEPMSLVRNTKEQIERQEGLPVDKDKDVIAREEFLDKFRVYVANLEPIITNRTTQLLALCNDS